MIRALGLESFRSIRKLGLRPKKLNILVGENGSGKTNFLRAIQLPGILARDERLQDVEKYRVGVSYYRPFNPVEIFPFRGKSEYRWEISAVDNDLREWRYGGLIKSDALPNSNLQIGDEFLIQPPAEERILNSTSPARSIWSDIQRGSEYFGVREMFNSLATVFDLDTYSLVSGASMSRPSLDIVYNEQGGNFASLVRDLNEKHTKRYVEIQDWFENESGFRLEVRTEPDGIVRLWFKPRGSSVFHTASSLPMVF